MQCVKSVKVDHPTTDGCDFNSVERLGKFNTTVKNTFLELSEDPLDDEELVCNQKHRRCARTCPNHLEVGDESPMHINGPHAREPLYVQLPTGPAHILSPRASARVVLSSSHDETESEGKRAVPAFKPIIKNTFIDINLDGLDEEEEELQSMQKGRRCSQTCPHDLGWGGDMPAYVSLPPSPIAAISSPSSSIRTNISLWPAGDVFGNMDGLGLNDDLMSRLKPTIHGAKASAKIMLGELISQDFDLGSEEFSSTVDEPAREPSPDSHVDVVPEVSCAGGIGGSGGSRWFCNSTDKPKNAEVMPTARHMLCSYGNGYLESLRQPTCVDSLMRSRVEPCLAQACSLQSSISNGDVKLYRQLMHEDSRPPPPPAYTAPSADSLGDEVLLPGRLMHKGPVPPPPLYSAPSADMFNPCFDIVQKKSIQDGHVQHRQSSMKTITEICLERDSVVHTTRTITEICLEQTLPGPRISNTGSASQLVSSTRCDLVDMGICQSGCARKERGLTDNQVNCDRIAEPLQQRDDMPVPKVAALSPERAATLSARAKPFSKKNNRRSHADRLWCHIYIDKAMLEDGFDLVKKIIGREGCNTKKIYIETLTKVRVRGQGSGHQEQRNGKEAQVHLMMALAADQGRHEEFKKAFVMAKTLLQDVSRRFASFCRHRQQHVPAGPRFWVGESSDESLACLGEALGDVPVGRLDLE